MKLLIIFIFFFPLLSACDNKHPDRKAQVTPLSLWLIHNEDSLYGYMTTFIKGDPRLKDTSTTYVEYTIDTLLFKSLNNKIRDFDSCIIVHINYKPKEKMPFEILLTSDFKNGCTSSIDKIFSDIDSLRHFSIVKYRPANGAFGGLFYESDSIMPEQLKFGVLPSGKYDLTVYVFKPISKDMKENLIELIFGEEVLEKRINKIDYKLLKDTTLTTKDADDIQSFFDVKDK